MDDDEVQRLNRPVCARPAWLVGTDGLVVEWSKRDGLCTAYVYVPRKDRPLVKAVGCGLEFWEAVARVRRAALDVEVA